jgi:hypothetical protein
MSLIHYCAAWTESDCFISCGHSHGSVGEAVACGRVAGAYVVAVDAGTIRALSSTEEAEFQFAIHGRPGANAAVDAPAIVIPTAIDSRYGVMTRIRVGDQWRWTTWMCFETYAEASAHAREGDKVARFHSAEWQALWREITVAPPSHACADTDHPTPSEGETPVEFVFRLLGERGIDQNGDLRVQPESINSERTPHERTQQRKRA